MVVLLPRLPGPAAEAIVQKFLNSDPGDWRSFDSRELPRTIRFAATGGNRATERELLELRHGLKTLAERHGFKSGAIEGKPGKFDTDCTKWLADQALFKSGEALRDDVWSFIGAVLAPDIVLWRFGSSSERFFGGIRNTFQRLWIRGRVLDRGSEHLKRWELIEELTEDAFVQITERPSLGNDPILAKALAEAWLRASARLGRGAMETVMRRAALSVRIRNEILCLSELQGPKLDSYLDEVFSLSATTTFPS